MNFFKPAHEPGKPGSLSGEKDIFAMLEEELSSALSMYWEIAGGILEGSGVRLLDPPSGYLSIENNFFSALFLYSYCRAGIKKSRRIIYSAMNQCLRGMVTGCDNLLDNEYKKTLITDLPEGGTKFRSVLDIMVSDRVLFELSLNSFKEKEKILASSIMSLQGLVRSGYQEAAEESGIDEILLPDSVINEIHHYKTGILFNCPWAVPSVIEELDEGMVKYLNNSLYRIGIGCQIMDDMADVISDVHTGRHNYIASLIYHESGAESYKLLRSMASEETENYTRGDVYMKFGSARNKACLKARSYLSEGFRDLFEEKYRWLVESAIVFLAGRIGVDKYFQAGCHED